MPGAMPRVTQSAYFILTPAPEDAGGGPLFYAVRKGGGWGSNLKGRRAVVAFISHRRCIGSEAGDEVLS